MQLARSGPMVSPGGLWTGSSIMHRFQNMSVVDSEGESCQNMTCEAQRDRPTFTESMNRTKYTCGMVACGQKCTGEAGQFAKHGG